MLAIVGAGVLGLSTARELQSAGLAVKIFDPDPGQGASAGASRIWRQTHADPRLVRLSAQAAELWDRANNNRQEKICAADGLLYRGPDSKQRYRRLADAGIAAEWVSADQRSPLPTYLAPALFEPGAGAIDSRQVVNELLAEQEENIITEAVSEFSVQPSGAVQVTSASGQQQFTQLIIVCGLGLPELLPQWAEDIELASAEHLRLDFPIDKWQNQERRPAAFIDTYRQASGVGNFAAPGSQSPLAPSYGLGIKTKQLELAEQQLIELAGELSGLTTEPQGREEHPVLSLAGREDSWALYHRGPVIALAAGNAFKWSPVHAQALSALAQDRRPTNDWRIIAEHWRPPEPSPWMTEQ
jgi:sarcosine oxidase